MVTDFRAGARAAGFTAFFPVFIRFLRRPGSILPAFIVNLT
jgi:hypothetical protein